MYRYRISGQRYGGELCIGTVSQEFYDHFKDKPQDELIEKLFDWDNEEPGPQPREDFEDYYWHDLDDLEHMSGCFTDCEVLVQEIDKDGNELDYEDYVDLRDCHQVYSRECYLDTHEAGQPAVAIFSLEKGHFWEVVVETEEEFDHNKLFFGGVETDLACLVESVAYDGKELELCYDDYSTNGKGTEVMLGLYNEKWHEKFDSYDIETVLKEEDYV